MPPDISAGLTALAAAPPGAAFSAGPPLPEPLSASLFAAFLARSEPPSITPAVDPKQAGLKPPMLEKALPKSKTMDTLPTLSFSPKTRVNAGELPVSQIARHQKAAEDQTADGTPIPNTPSLVPALASPPAAPLPLAASVLPLPAAVLPVTAAPGRSAPISQSRRDTPALIPMSAFAPAQAAPDPTGLPLPRTWSLTPPLQTEQPPLATAPATGAEQGMGLKAAGITAVKPAAAAAAKTAGGLPRVPSPVSFVPLQAVPQARGIPQEAAPALSPSAAVAAPLASALPASETPKFSPAKTTGKFLPAALKPAGENADTYTRTTPGQEPTVSAKAGVPAAMPGPDSERHTEEQKPSLTADSGTASVPMFSQAASAETGKAEPKPLSAQDRAEVVRQAAEAVMKAPLPAKTGASEQMSVQLHPKDWGSLQVSVSVAPGQNVEAAKTVTAHIVAETPQVKAALQSRTGALHEALRASGLHLEHLTVSVKAPEGKMVEVKTAAQSASAGLSSGQSQSDKSGQSYGQPNAGAGSGTNGFGNGFGTGGSQNNRQGQPPPLLPGAPEPDAEDDFLPATPLRPAAGRIDTRA